MRRIYKTLLPPLIVFSISSPSAFSENVKDFNLQAELLENGDISLISSINKSPNACIYLSYIQILRNYESAIDTDIDGTPVLSRWETVWENSNINVLNSGFPKVDINKAREQCKNQGSDNRFSSRLINAIQRLAGNTDNRSNSEMKSQAIILKQGEEFLGFNALNQSSDYEDAELKVSAIYIKPTAGNIFQSTKFGLQLNTANQKVSTQFISLKPTRLLTTQHANHNFSYPGFVPGKKMPLAYIASTNNLGCLGKVMPKSKKSLLYYVASSYHP